MDILRVILVKNSLTLLKNKDCLHEQAAGIGIAAKNLNKFIRYCNKKLANTNMGEGTFFVDFEFNGSNCGEIGKICVELNPLSKIYGKGIEEPKLIVKDIIFDENDVFIMGKDKNSAKITKNGISFVKFKDSDFADAVQNYKLGLLTICGKMNLNEYMGTVTPQVIIENYELGNAKAMF